MNCPKCNTKMKWDGCVCTSNPPKYMHKCPKCGHIEYANTYDLDDREDPYFHYDDIMKEQTELVGSLVDSITLDTGKSKAKEYSTAARDVMYESFRAKAAIAAMQSFILKSKQEFDSLDEALHYYEETIPNNAIICADALIAKLKKD